MGKEVVGSSRLGSRRWSALSVRNPCGSLTNASSASWRWRVNPLTPGYRRSSHCRSRCHFPPSPLWIRVTHKMPLSTTSAPSDSLLPPQARVQEQQAAVTENEITISPSTRFRAAMILAIIADALQIVVFPLFVEGAVSPADDILDLGVGAALVYLLGWHWEFLPSFLAKLVPGVDLVPFWTMAVANVYRRSKRTLIAEAERREEP